MGDSGPSDSQAGDDPAFEGDEGVGYGNVDTTTQQFQDDQRQENQRSNIVDSSSYDAQFTADNLESRGLDPSNFMSSDNYSQTTQAARESGFDTPSISVPSIQAAGTSPTFAQNIFAPDEIRATMDTPSQTMVEALGSPSMKPADVKRETVVDNSQLGLLNAALQNAGDLRRSYDTLLDNIQFGVGTKGSVDSANVPNKVDFGATNISRVGDDFGPALDMVDARMQDPNANIDPFVSFDVSANQQSIVGDDFGPALDMVDSRTTATGAEDPFDPNVGKAFDAKRMADIEAIYGKFDPETGSYPTTAPGLFGLVEDRTKDALATSIALGRNLNPIEAVFGYTAPNMAKDKETIEEYNKRINARIPDSQLVRNDSGVVIGIKDAMGNLVTGRDPSAQQTDQGSESGKERVKPKAPTDPCPEGYQLIDGKCTPIAEAATGTGFQVFPANRNPAYRTGPFSPATVATGAGGIRGLNPITFNPFNK